MKEYKELWDFVKDHLAIALNCNPDPVYSNQEYEQAKAILNPHDKKIVKTNRQMLIKSLACLIHSATKEKQYIDSPSDKEYFAQGQRFREYHKNIKKLNKVIECFRNAVDLGSSKKNLEFEKSNPFFNIREITFKGYQKKLVLSGLAIEVVRSMFSAFGEVETNEEQQKLKEFSYDLYESWAIFYEESIIASAPKDILAHQQLKNREINEKDAAIDIYNKKIAASLHRVLSKFSIAKATSNNKIPTWHSRVVGELLLSVGLFDEYYNIPHYNKLIWNWIYRACYQ